MPDDTEVIGQPDGPEELSAGAGRRWRWLALIGVVLVGAVLALGVVFVVFGDDDETGSGTEPRAARKRSPSSITTTTLLITTTTHAPPPTLTGFPYDTDVVAEIHSPVFDVVIPVVLPAGGNPGQWTPREGGYEVLNVRDCSWERVEADGRVVAQNSGTSDGEHKAFTTDAGGSVTIRGACVVYLGAGSPDIPQTTPPRTTGFTYDTDVVAEAKVEAYYVEIPVGWEPAEMPPGTYDVSYVRDCYVYGAGFRFPRTGLQQALTVNAGEIVQITGHCAFSRPG